MSREDGFKQIRHLGGRVHGRRDRTLASRCGLQQTANQRHHRAVRTGFSQESDVLELEQIAHVFGGGADHHDGAAVFFSDHLTSSLSADNPGATDIGLEQTWDFLRMLKLSCVVRSTLR